MGKVGILVPIYRIHEPQKKRMFEYTIHTLLETKEDIHLFSANELDTEVVMEYAEKYPQCTVHRGYPNSEWLKVHEAYDYLRSKYPYIAICHDDDLWMKYKLQHQLKYIQNHILIMTSFVMYVYNWKPDFISNNIVQREYPELGIPVIDKEIGVWNCMPSTWMLNTKLCKEIPILFNETACHDSAIVNYFTSIGSVGVVRQPYVIYRDSINNQWHTETISDKHKENGKRLIVELMKTIPVPKLTYYWE